MKLYKTLLASTLCMPLIPALAGGVLLDFNNILGAGNVAPILDAYKDQGFHFSHEALAVRSNQSGNTEGNGGFYTPNPTGGGNTNIGALAISADNPVDGQPSSFTVSADHGFGGYFSALVGVSQQSNVSIEVRDKDNHLLTQNVFNVPNSTGGCDQLMVCNWTSLDLSWGDETAYSIVVSGMEDFAWFDNFEFGAPADTGGGNDAPEPASLLLAASALGALAWSRRHSSAP